MSQLPIENQRIAILGLGRSGLAIGRAALRFGARPVVFDETPEDRLVKRDVLEEARSIGLDVRLGPVKLPADAFDLLILNPAIPPSHPAIAAALTANLEVIGEIEFAFRISKAPIIAITGTNGKSTTTVMTYLCLRNCGVDAVLCGNIFGSGYPEMPLTEAALNATKTQVLVAEVSSFQLEWIKDFKPIAAAVTNITSDHLDRHGSQAAYAAAKLRIFANQTEDDVAVFDSRLTPITRARKFPIDSNNPEPYLELPGEAHQRLNAAMALRLAQAAMGNPEVLPTCAIAALKEFQGLSHRMERLGSKHGITVINNSMCTNPAAVISSVEDLNETVHLLLGGVNKGLDFEPLKQYLKQTNHKVYLFGTDALELAKMLSINGDTYRTMQEAFEAATDRAAEGDTIILAPGCASTDQFRDFRHRGDVFKAVAMEWLKT